MRGGAGGMGAPKFGGIGGKGGDVILKTQKSKLSRLFFYI